MTPCDCIDPDLQLDPATRRVMCRGCGLEVRAPAEQRLADAVELAMAGGVALAPAAVEAVAERVAELLADTERPAVLVDAAEIARRFAVSRDYVYANADRLGAVRLGDGQKPRIRFDPDLVAERLGAQPSVPPSRPRRTKPNLLPIHHTPTSPGPQRSRRGANAGAAPGESSLTLRSPGAPATKGQDPQ